MVEIYEAFQADIARGPQWVAWWVNFMGLVFLPSLFFFPFRREARWAFLTMFVLTIPAMLALYAQVGMVRLLGIVHIVLWTPLLIALLRTRSSWRTRETWAGKWIVLLCAVMLVSLAFDIADVVRYVLGERTPL